MAGNVDLMITQPNSRDLVTTGKMRALAVSSAKRSAFYPELPTVDEAGVPGYRSVAWYGLVGPKGMPATCSRSPMRRARCRNRYVKSIVAPTGRDIAANAGGLCRVHRCRAAALRRHRPRCRDDGANSSSVSSNTQGGVASHARRAGQRRTRLWHEVAHGHRLARPEGRSGKGVRAGRTVLVGTRTPSRWRERLEPGTPFASDAK